MSVKSCLAVLPPKQRFYLPSEVAQHSSATDCWVSLFGEVFNLTALVQENAAHPGVTPLIKAAGTDITFWFDSSTREPRTCVDR